MFLSEGPFAKLSQHFPDPPTLKAIPDYTRSTLDFSAHSLTAHWLRLLHLSVTQNPCSKKASRASLHPTVALTLSPNCPATRPCPPPSPAHSARWAPMPCAKAAAPGPSLEAPHRPQPPACSRGRPPIHAAHLVLRRGARGAHGAEGGGPGAPHASGRPWPPERRSGQHAGSRWRRRRSQGRGNGAATRTQRRQREPARATARHRSVPSGAVAIRAPDSVSSPLRDPCSGTFRSKFRVLGFVDPGSGISQSKFSSSSQTRFGAGPILIPVLPGEFRIRDLLQACLPPAASGGLAARAQLPGGGN